MAQRFSALASRSPEFSSQQPYGSSQPSEIWYPLLVYRYTCRQNTTYIIYLNKNENLKMSNKNLNIHTHTNLYQVPLPQYTILDKNLKDKTSQQTP